MRIRQTSAALLGAFSLVSSALAADSTAGFTEARAVLEKHCFSCHGPEKQKAGLRFDQGDSILKGTDTGPILVSGKPEESAIIKLVRGDDPEKVMPPKGPRLTPAEIGILEKWIRSGAAWPQLAGSEPQKQHWAFTAPTKPAVPKLSRTDRKWARNAIDAFIVKTLEDHGMKPSPEADRITLIRRLSLDLRGLLPSAEEVREFVGDRRSDAYERLVDRMLDSPHFGERWGRHWLDLARYADSEGYQIDLARPYAYLYRDWVIRAFNADLPFDRFTVEQLAGDLLPNATLDQKIAAGFHRNTLMNHEDGTDKEEFRVKAKKDRVSTTATVWLGLTLGCAECHTHKYDPIPQKEFYQVYALFNQADEVSIFAPQPDDPKAQAASFAEKKEPVSTHIQIRGDFLRPGPEVAPGALSALHPFHARGPRADRFDLARWIVDPANPLTARVAVNHFWQHLFGRGLVSTPEDFGTRGEPPSHPELLDWLAVTFREQGWSRKKMIRTMVLSATYRQASLARPEYTEKDPLNIWLARQNRWHVESELVRDLNLQAARQLNLRIGGPSFRPFMPPEIKALGAAGAFKWEDSTGPERFRRGLYVFGQRTVPYPVSMTFDQANPSECCPRRTRSNTPLQALTLLNNGIFFDAACGLGRDIENAPGVVSEKIRFGFEQCMSRPPSHLELQRLARLYDDLVRTQSASPWTTIAQVLLNLDEFLTRE